MSRAPQKQRARRLWRRAGPRYWRLRPSWNAFRGTISLPMRFQNKIRRRYSPLLSLTPRAG